MFVAFLMRDNKRAINFNYNFKPIRLKFVLLSFLFYVICLVFSSLFFSHKNSFTFDKTQIQKETNDLHTLHNLWLLFYIPAIHSSIFSITYLIILSKRKLNLMFFFNVYVVSFSFSF